MDEPATPSRRVAVAGASGVVGRHVVAALAAAGHDAVPLSRAPGVDVVTGAGLATALEGADAVVDVTNVQTLRRGTALRFFEGATRALLRAGAKAAVRHHVALSVVGADLVPSGYYAAKIRQEQLVRESGGTVLRATQFHEFADQVMARSAIGPVRVVPRMRVQPVAAADVGQALAELAVGPVVGRAPDLGGPEVHELPDLCRRVLAARGQAGRVVAVRPPGRVGSGMARGRLLPGAGARAGTTTFDDWLAADLRPG